MTDHSDLIAELGVWAADMRPHPASVLMKRAADALTSQTSLIAEIESRSDSYVEENGILAGLLSEAREEIERLKRERDEQEHLVRVAERLKDKAYAKRDVAVRERDEARQSWQEAADALTMESNRIDALLPQLAAAEKRRDYYRVRMDIAERDREEADARVRAAQPFFAIRDAIPIGDGLKLVSKDRFDDMTPITITVTKGQYLRAFEAFSAAARSQGSLPEHADATNDPADPSLSSLRKGAEVAVKPLEWEMFWKQDEGRREIAQPPIGDSYHVSEQGWWHALDVLHECAGIEAAKAAAQSDFETRIRSALVSGSREDGA